MTTWVATLLCGVFVLAGVQLKAQGSAAQPSKNSSSELVGQLTKGLSITRTQARGGALREVGAYSSKTTLRRELSI